MTTDDDFQHLFDYENGNNASIVCNTGYRKPLSKITLSDKDEVKKIIRDYNTIINTKAEVDQFCVGLSNLGVLEMAAKHQRLMSTFFIPQCNVLIKGNKILCLVYCLKNFFWGIYILIMC